MSYRTMTPDEAKTVLDGDQGYVYIDVRSTPEFSEGHALGAHHVPWAEVNPATGQMEPNSDFEKVLTSTFSKDAPLVVACAAGGRSRAACETLASAGFTDLINMHGGFMGARDPMGNLLQEGWKGMGFPCATGDEGGVTYASILSKIPKE